MGAEVRIDELVIRVPGLTREEAREFAQQVAKLLVAKLSSGAESRHYGAIRVKARMPAGTSKAKLAELVSDEIAESLSCG